MSLPKRIYVDPILAVQLDNGTLKQAKRVVEYVRADIHAALEAKIERLQRERDDLREIGSRLVAAIDGALDDSAVAPLSVLMMVRAEMDGALEGREP